ncbi:MAG: NUDIX hydrolase [Burkholderiaceae bacterium]|nr:MAG: NUDIX hydrolase [Burkholderiaceae bacterium]
MQLNSEAITSPPRAAATVVMLRDAAAGLEVFLLRRHSLSDVLGGAYVFPGGKVDAHDAELDMAARLDQSPQQLHAGLNEPEIDDVTAASLYVAALREVFEESGVLFAQEASTRQVAQAGDLLRQGCGFDEMLSRMALRLQTRGVVPWSRWITPKVASIMNRRFDTRFFVSAVPPYQVARHDEHETTDSAWLRPRAALEQYRDGHIDLAPPQIMSLAHLSHHATVDSVLQEARGRRPPAIRPESFEQGGERVMCYPGDERHSIHERALPGPTRLRYHNQRFEPLDGFEALFA